MDRKEIAKEFADRILSRFKDRIEKIILFGSVARGESGANSDIDILVVTRQKDIGTMKEICGVAYDVSIRHFTAISQKFYPHDKIVRSLRVMTPFIEEILNDEVPLYGSIRDYRAAT
jgi:predicted nucleotidyltransferase